MLGIDVHIPDLGARGALNDAGELSVFTSNKYGIPHFVHKTRRHCKKQA